MPYSKKTNLLNIPFMGNGDVMTEDDNNIQMNIIDKLLYINNTNLFNCILYQGNYNYEINENNYKIIISPKINLINEQQNLTADNFSLSGILNNNFFYSTNIIEIENLNNNKNYYIYVKEKEEGLKTNPNNFQIEKSENLKDNVTNQIYLCKINIENNQVNIDINVNGKLYLEDKYPSYEYISFFSGLQNYEYSFPENKEIIFATAYAQELNTNIAWEINKENKKIIFKTSGANGIKINVKLELKKDRSNNIIL